MAQSLSTQIIQILEVPSEIGAGTRGASLGIEAMKLAALNKGSDFFLQYPPRIIHADNHILHEPIDHPFAKGIEHIVSLYERVSTEVAATVTHNPFTILLAGDHSIAGGTIAGVKRAYPEKRLGVIWIDAHADLHSPYTTPSGNVHGMPLATAIAEDNLDLKVNDIDAETESYWEQLKSIGEISPKVDPRDLVLIAVRDTEFQEDFLKEKHQIKNYSVAEFRERGVNEIVEEARRKLSDCDLIYVSFDVDSMDSALSQGTGTPVSGGITNHEAMDLLGRLVQDPKVVCLEVTEVNPILDMGNRMAEMTFEILESVVEARAGVAASL